MSPTQIAQEVDKHRSTIYRELGRNQASEGGYFPDTANIYAIQRKVEAASISRIDEDMKAWVIEKILLQWNREQISNRMKLELGESLSHEWIYEMFYADRKEGGTLYLHENSKETRRRER